MATRLAPKFRASLGQVGQGTVVCYIPVKNVINIGPGRYVRPKLIPIVPRNVQIEIEACWSNRDVGFANSVPPAVIEDEACPFTRIGLIQGSLTNIPDAVPERHVASRSPLL